MMETILIISKLYILAGLFYFIWRFSPLVDTYYEQFLDNGVDKDQFRYWIGFIIFLFLVVILWPLMAISRLED